MGNTGAVVGGEEGGRERPAGNGGGGGVACRDPGERCFWGYKGVKGVDNAYLHHQVI